MRQSKDFLQKRKRQSERILLVYIFPLLTITLCLWAVLFVILFYYRLLTMLYSFMLLPFNRLLEKWSAGTYRCKKAGEILEKFWDSIKTDADEIRSLLVKF